jgi:hypothetical protein
LLRMARHRISKARAVLVGAHDRAVDHGVFVVCILGQNLE